MKVSSVNLKTALRNDGSSSVEKKNIENHVRFDLLRSSLKNHTVWKMYTTYFNPSEKSDFSIPRFLSHEDFSKSFHRN